MSLDTEWKKFVRRGKDIAAKIPYAQRVWGFLQPRQIPRPRGTEAFTPRIWDGQYARGDWAYMVDEHTRYAVIAWFTGQYLPPNGSLLDLGCGEGILTTAFVDLPYGRYVGVDFSKKALEFAAKRGNSRTTFFHSDITRYRPRQQFDIIVFNEVLYYLKEPGQILERYAKFLTLNGVLIISLFQGVQRGKNIYDQILRCKQFHIVDEKKTDQANHIWQALVIRPAYDSFQLRFPRTGYHGRNALQNLK